jgi:diguanylate cyclase (GGDEF)-like protein/PAS domain S-box-containing protein
MRASGLAAGIALAAILLGRRLASSRRAVKLAEDRFRALFENAPYSRLVIDGAGRISMANLEAERMFGEPVEQLVGRSAEEFLPTPPGRAGAWYVQPLSATANDRPAEMELVARRSAGGEFPVEVSLTPLASEGGTVVSVAIRDVTELRLAAEALTHQASHDALTGLPNRVLFLERLEMALHRARRSGRAVAVLFLDVDDFKLVNDTRGHDAGDLLLRRVTPRLNAGIRQGDTLARLGGDEFVVLYEDLSPGADAAELGQRIVDALEEPVVVAGAEHAVSISAGIVIVRDAATATATGMMRDADAAMYSAKAGGKGRFAVFDETMREELLERIAIESSLRGALGREELEVFYQPVVALDPGRIVAAEALLRWRHPLRGLLTPADFIPAAERTGVIGEIGQWVIEQACRQASRWRDAAAEAGGDPIPVSVNVSAAQLKRPGLARAVGRILGDSGLEPGLLELEVTESVLLEAEAVSRAELRELKDLGVKLIVDNFGTGYSSLATLRDLMIDGLKLDRSFVQALERDGEDADGALVGAVLNLAGALDAEVTAEGVETQAQASRLRLAGCDYAQGYLFARPAPAGELTALIAGEAAGPWRARGTRRSAA